MTRVSGAAAAIKSWPCPKKCPAAGGALPAGRWVLSLPQGSRKPLSLLVRDYGTAALPGGWHTPCQQDELPQLLITCGDRVIRAGEWRDGRVRGASWNQHQQIWQHRWKKMTSMGPELERAAKDVWFFLQNPGPPLPIFEGRRQGGCRRALPLIVETAEPPGAR